MSDLDDIKKILQAWKSKYDVDMFDIKSDLRELRGDIKGSLKGKVLERLPEGGGENP